MSKSKQGKIVATPGYLYTYNTLSRDVRVHRVLMTSDLLVTIESGISGQVIRKIEINSDGYYFTAPELAIDAFVKRADNALADPSYPETKKPAWREARTEALFVRNDHVMASSGRATKKKKAPRRSPRRWRRREEPRDGDREPVARHREVAAWKQGAVVTSLREKYQVDVPEGTSGDWRIVRETVTEDRARLNAVLAMGHGHGRFAPAGTYTVLYRHNTIVMSDTTDEIHDHLRFVYRATGRVLIAGLGLGMVLQAVASKPEVTHVTVIEKSQDVIALVHDHYKAKPWGDKFDVICADIFEWKPGRTERWNAAWFDVWDNLCTDNLSEMATLHRRYARRVDDYGSWGHSLLKHRREQERRAGW